MAALLAACLHLLAVGFHDWSMHHADGAAGYAASGDVALGAPPCPHHSARNPDDGRPADADGGHACPLCGITRLVGIVPSFHILIVPQGSAPAPVRFTLAPSSPRAPPHSGQPRAPPVSI